MDIQEGLDQAAVESAESGNAGGGADGAAIDTTAGGSTQDGAGNHGAELTPEQLKEKEKELLRGFHSKTQALAEKERALDQYVKDARAFYGLSDQQWFKQAVEAEKARRAGAGPDLSDEAFEALKSDKKAFLEYQSRRDKALVESVTSQFKPELEKLGKSQEELHANREFEGVAAKYGKAFKDANDTGALDSYLQKGLDYDTAFILHEQAHGRVAGKAPATPADRRGSITDKGGMSSARGGPVVKAKSLDDYLDRALDLIGRGSKDYRITKE
jgi:hypothetical protein